MKIFYTLKKETDFTAVALGYFDGVHKGHQKVISNAVLQEKNNLKPIVFTFLNSPKCILNNIIEEKILNFEQKAQKIEKLGVKTMYAIDFLKIYKLTPQKFVKNVLVDKLNAKFVSCGENFKFGYKNSGCAEDLKTFCEKYQIFVKIAPLKTFLNEPISTTRIKNDIKLKKFLYVEKMLGMIYNNN
jgi:riboflavin kinase/FMN adenylyltransferase